MNLSTNYPHENKLINNSINFRQISKIRYFNSISLNLKIWLNVMVKYK